MILRGLEKDNLIPTSVTGSGSWTGMAAGSQTARRKVPRLFGHPLAPPPFVKGALENNPVVKGIERVKDRFGIGEGPGSNTPPPPPPPSTTKAPPPQNAPAQTDTGTDNGNGSENTTTSQTTISSSQTSAAQTTRSSESSSASLSNTPPHPTSKPTANAISTDRSTFTSSSTDVSTTSSSESSSTLSETSISPSSASQADSTFSTPSPSSTALQDNARTSPRAVGGIVAGVVIGVFAIIFIVLFILMRRRRAARAASRALSFTTVNSYPFTGANSSISSSSMSYRPPPLPLSPHSLRGFDPAYMVTRATPPTHSLDRSLSSSTVDSIGVVATARRDVLSPAFTDSEILGSSQPQQLVYGSHWSTAEENRAPGMTEESYFGASQPQQAALGSRWSTTEENRAAGLTEESAVSPSQPRQLGVYGSHWSSTENGESSVYPASTSEESAAMRQIPNPFGRDSPVSSETIRGTSESGHFGRAS